MPRSAHNEPALRWPDNGWREKIRHLCVHGANRYPVFLRTSQFRQFITLVFLFLLMVLCCIVGSSVLSETLIRTHVRDVILGNIHDHTTQARLTDTSTLIAQLKRDNQAKTDELPIFLVMSKQGEILYHNAGWMLSGPNHTACKMDVPCLKALLVEKGALGCLSCCCFRWWSVDISVYAACAALSVSAPRCIATAPVSSTSACRSRRAMMISTA